MQSLPVQEHPKDPNDPAHYVTLQGRWKIERYTPDGYGKMVLAEVHEGVNVITTVGKTALATFLAAAAQAATTNTFKYMAIGTDSTAESAAQTALGTEVSRTTGTVSFVSDAIYQVKSTFAAGSGTGAIVEYGLFNSSSAGTMFCRDVESAINKGASDTLITTLQVTLS
jgi:hypothetical protein